MKLPLSTLLQIHAALAAFDGEMVPVRNKADEAIGMERRPCPVSDAVALKVAKISSAIKPHADKLNDTRTKLVSVATGGKAKIEQDDPKFGSIQESLTEILSTEVEAELPLIRYDDLKSAKFAPSILAALMPILTDLPKD